MDVFNFRLLSHIPGVPEQILNPSLLWDDKQAYANKVKLLANAFTENFKQFLEPVELPSFVTVDVDAIIKGAPNCN